MALEIMEERDSLWRKIVDYKYRASWDCCCTDVAGGSYEVSLWKHIGNGWTKFSTFLLYKVGNGSRIHFWHDLWCGDIVLEDAYPTFYNIVVNKEAAVADYLVLHTGRLHWSIVLF